MYPKSIGRKSEYSHTPGQIESHSAPTQIGEKRTPTNRYAITANKGVTDSVAFVASRGTTPTRTRTAMRRVLNIWNARNPIKNTLNVVPPEIRLTAILEGIG